MIIKQPDERKSLVATLEALRARPDASTDVRQRIDQEIRNIQAGMRGEAEAAYEIDFHFGPSRNHAIIHDLRIECEGRVAQIDHLIIGRFLDMWVCESKHFSEGIAINEQGECSAFFKNRPYGVASPFEQNRKHIIVLNSLFTSGLVKLPSRLGFSIKPNLHSVVLVSKGARISRPKAKLPGMENIIKNDQIRTFIDRAIDDDKNPLTMAKVIGSETLEAFAHTVAAMHKPITFKWAAKFGLPEEVPAGAAIQGPPPAAPVSLDEPAKEGPKQKQKLICAKCLVPVELVVARFCWFNKGRFGGNVYCRECQKQI